jgi:serpin B
MDKKIEQLVVAFLEGGLDEAETRRLVGHLEDHAEDRQEFLALAAQARAMEALFAPARDLSAAVLNELRARENGGRFVGKVMERLPRRLHRRWRPIALAAASVLLALGVAVWRAGPDQTPNRPDKPSPVAAHVRGGVLAAGWRGEGQGVKYQIAEPGLVRLQRGELFVESAPVASADTPRGTLRIETPAGIVTAKGTKFYIGAHTEAPQKKGIPMKQMTRVLVLAGMVTLANPLGTVTGGPNDLLAAEAGAAPVKHAVQANSDFAFDMYKQLAREKDNAGKNMFFSPYSISSALAMTAEGARGKTAAEMGKVLRFPTAARRVGADAQLIPWKTSVIHTGMGELNKRFNRPKKPYELKVANALWGERTFPFRQQFVQSLNGPYGAALMQANFIRNAEAERLRINGWVEQKTNQRIKDLLPEGILDEDTRLVLTNAIYFKGAWSQPFNRTATRKMRFTTGDGQTAQTPMMHHDPDGVKRDRRSREKIVWPFGYAAFDAAGKPTRQRGHSVQILEMPYAGGEMSMFVLLPAKPDGLPALEKQLNSAILAGWLKQVKRQEVAVWMPKFKMETEYGLKPTLKEMGMPSAFRAGGFTGMSDSSEAHKLYIAAVRHKAFVEVNEEGTEAAAATAVVMLVEGMPRYPRFAATRPFVFLIRDNQTGSILFLGRMMDPAK